MTNVLKALQKFSDSFLMTLGIEDAHNRRTQIFQITEAKMEILVEGLRAHVQEDQKRISRQITPTIQEFMKQGLIVML